MRTKPRLRSGKSRHCVTCQVAFTPSTRNDWTCPKCPPPSLDQLAEVTFGPRKRRCPVCWSPFKAASAHQKYCGKTCQSQRRLAGLHLLLHRDENHCTACGSPVTARTASVQRIDKDGPREAGNLACLCEECAPGSKPQRWRQHVRKLARDACRRLGLPTTWEIAP